MPVKNIRHLQVRPSQSADLSFNMPGVVLEQNYNHSTGVGPCHLGKSVVGFPIQTQLYDRLGDTLPANPPREQDARLKYDAAEIRNTLSGSFLFMLRNQALAAELNKLVGNRENAFLEKFKHAPAIQAAMQAVFPSIVNRISSLATLAAARFTQLDTEYGAGAVVKQSTSTTAGSSTTTSKTVAMRNAPAEPEVDARIVSHGIDPQDSDKEVQRQETEQTQSTPYLRGSQNGNVTWELPGEEFESQSVSSTSNITNDNPVFIHPKLDNRIEHEQMQIGLMLDKLQQELAKLRVPFLATVLANELAALDMDVRQMQLNYAHTFLVAPFSGVITAIYKDTGESVAAGEPVLRVENDEVVFIVGRIVHRALLTVGRNVIVHTTDLYEAGPVASFPGRIVSVRGHEADNDEWEIVIECPNPLDAGRRILPINYQFDRDNSHVEVQ